MPRTVKEWIGRSDDSKPPPRVVLRVFMKYDGRCQCNCNRKILTGESWQTDHRIAIINGGENRESNLHPILVEHHKNKTREDVAIKAKTYRKRKANYGIRKSRSITHWRKFDGTKVFASRERN